MIYLLILLKIVPRCPLAFQIPYQIKNILPHSTTMMPDNEIDGKHERNYVVLQSEIVYNSLYIILCTNCLCNYPLFLRNILMPE